METIFFWDYYGRRTRPAIAGTVIWYTIKMIKTLFPDFVKTFSTDPADSAGFLYPEEEALIQSAVPKRRAEFTAGRLGARKLLAEFGIKDFPLLAGEKREPLWPAGICGSITHTAGFCGAAAAQTDRAIGLGLDAEQIGKLGEKSWPTVCTPEELNWLSSFSVKEQNHYFALIFSAKECAYKCQFPLTRQWLDFHDVVISVDENIRTFRAAFPHHHNPVFTLMNLTDGHFHARANVIFTGITLEPVGRI